MVKKILLLATAALFATAGAAHAGDGYADDDTLTISDSTVEPGDAVTATAQTFLSGAQVTWTLFSAPIVVGTSTANAAGVATITFTVPNVPAGTHRLEATGTGADGQPLTVATTLTVTGAGTGTGTGQGGGLPKTGSDSAVPMTQIALGAIAGGGLLVLLANKRRTNRLAQTTAGA